MCFIVIPGEGKGKRKSRGRQKKEKTAIGMLIEGGKKEVY